VVVVLFCVAEHLERNCRCAGQGLGCRPFCCVLLRLRHGVQPAPITAELSAVNETADVLQLQLVAL
jgi:hypothetical protein